MAARNASELIVFLLDVGQHMSQLCDEESSYFERSLYCIKKILERKIFAESKDEVALVLVGTEDTDNRLAQDDQYLNIVEMCRLKIVDWDLMKCVENIHLSSTSGDFVDGLVIASNVLVDDSVGKKHISKKIVIFSNFASHCTVDQLEKIIAGIKRTEIEINVIGINVSEEEDFQDNDMQDGHRNDNRVHRSSMEMQKRSLKTMERILNETNGESYSFDEAVPILLFFQKKAIRSAPWKVALEIGPDLQIPVCSYLKTRVFRPKSWQNAYTRDEGLKLQTETSYHINDEAQTEVDKEETIPAYRYGRTLVPVSKDDQLNLKYESPGKGLTVLGCTDKKEVPRHHYLGDSVRVVVADPDDEAASVALSAFIHALHETSMVAIVRYCYSKVSNPSIGFLSPVVKPDYECLIFSFLPFMEDLRHYTFASLTAKTKNIPTEEQLEAIDDLITARNLITYEDEEKREILKPKTLLNPYIQRLFQNLCFRALNPEEPLPDIEKHVMKNLSPSDELLAASEPALKKIKELFPLEIVAQKKAVKTGADIFQSSDVQDDVQLPKRAKLDMASGIAAMAKGPVTSIGTDTPLQDFEVLCKQPGIDASQVCTDLQNIITKMINASFGTQFYGKVVECLKGLRSQASKSAFEKFNKFIKELKSDVKASRKDLWLLIVKDEIGLITTDENPASGVSAEDAAKFFKDDDDEGEETMDNTIPDDDYDELLANM